MTAELTDRDRALWAAVARSVTPLKGGLATADTVVRQPVATAPPRPPREPPSNSPKVLIKALPPQLDGSWERRLARGALEPDFTLDLHGLRLDGAWQRLDTAVDRMVDQGGRVLLVIAGRDRGAEVRTDPGARGRIRAKLPDWLASGRHASRILAVRPAHARHGGGGAVYVILKRAAR